MTELYLTYDEHRTGGEICKGQENDDWPMHEDENIEWRLQKCRKSRDNKSWRSQEQIKVDFDPKIGSTVWVLYVRYGTGGTFCHTNGAWSILGVYEHQGQAGKVRKTVLDGTYPDYKCWEGYFENFESCEIESMTVEA